MQFKMERLGEFLACAKRVVKARNTMPVLQNVMVAGKGKYAEITATDLETTVVGNVPLESPDNSEMLINLKILADILDKNYAPDGLIMLTGSSGQVEIKTPYSTYRLAAIPVSEFPPVNPAYREENSAAIEPRLLKIMSQIVKKEGGRSLDGIFFGPGRVVATDGHGLFKLSTECNIRARLSKTGAAILADLMINSAHRRNNEQSMEKLCFANNNFCYRDAAILASVRADEDNPAPDVDKVIKYGGTILEVSRYELEAILDRLMIIDPKDVQIDISAEGTVVLKSSTPELGSAEASFIGEVSGGPVTVHLNPSYLMMGLSAYRGGDVKIHFNGPNEVICLKDGNLEYALMPRRGD